MGTRVTASSVVLVLLVVLMRAGPAIAAPPLVLTDDRSDAVLEIEGFTGGRCC